MESKRDMHPYAAVICPVHGTVPLTDDEYMNQLMLAAQSWFCPVKGCNRVCTWDDRSKAVNPIPE